MILPPRTFLYSLPFLGMGTPFLESFPGYFLRLSVEHRVGSGTLIHDLGQPCHKHERPILTAYWANIIRRTAEATGQPVELLTIKPWQPLLSRLLPYRRHQAWCPQCVTANPEMHQPLLWALRDNKSCHVHGDRLIDRCLCGACFDRLIPLREWKCYSCMSSLADVEPTPADEWETHQARQIAEVISQRHLSSGGSISTSTLNAEYRRRYGSVKNAAKKVGIMTFYRAAYSLEQVLYLSAKLKLPLGMFLGTEPWNPETVDNNAFPEPIIPVNRIQRVAQRREELSKLSRNLQVFAGVKEFAARFDLSPRSARINFYGLARSGEASRVHRKVCRTLQQYRTTVDELARRHPHRTRGEIGEHLSNSRANVFGPQVLMPAAKTALLTFLKTRLPPM